MLMALMADELEPLGRAAESEVISPIYAQNVIRKGVSRAAPANSHAVLRREKDVLGLPPCRKFSTSF